jgi:hypothetical protein
MNIHGKTAVLYLGAGGGVAIPIAEQIDWSIDMDVAMVDTTPLNNTWKQFVKGMLGYTGTFAGNFDPNSNQLWLASISNVAEKWYLYPQSAVPSLFYSGTAWVQLGKVAAGSTTTKASSSIKFTGQNALATTP